MRSKRERISPSLVSRTETTKQLKATEAKLAEYKRVFETMENVTIATMERNKTYINELHDLRTKYDAVRDKYEALLEDQN